MDTQGILIVFVTVYFSGWVMGTWVLIVFFSMIKDCLKKKKRDKQMESTDKNKRLHQQNAIQKMTHPGQVTTFQK